MKVSSSSSSSSGQYDGTLDALPSTTAPSSTTTTATATTTATWIQRRDLLHERLEALGTMNRNDTNALYNAMMQSIENPMQGYNDVFGKSAIKTYKSFLFPKNHQHQQQQQVDTTSSQQDEWRLLSAMAARTAQQIDFLMKRHTSHATPWIRHHDGTTTTTTTTTTINGNDNDDDSFSETTTTKTTTTTCPTTTFPIILLLDNVRSAMNVGSLFRTADAAGCTAVWTTGITPHPHGNGADKLSKAALGAERIVPSRHFATTYNAIQYARRRRQQQRDHRHHGHDGDSGSDNNDNNDNDDDLYTNYTLVGMETTSKSVDYTKVVYPDYYTIMKNASANNSHGAGASTDADADAGAASSGGGIILVLGNEVTGIDVQILNELDIIVEIPMFGVKNSLNVAACAPIVIYEILRQWNNNNKQEQ